MNIHPITDFQHASFHGDIGIARVDITPPVGIYARNWGAAKHDVAESIHRPLTLSSLSLRASDSSDPLVLIDADLGWWKTPQTFNQFQSELLSALNLDSSQLIFALTHTHAGPPLMDPDESLPGSDVLAKWSVKLRQSALDVVNQSRASMFPATLDWHVGRCGLATFRDLPDPDPDQTRVLCGFNPSGNPDDTLLLGRITDAEGKVRGTLVNYACHPTTLAAENTAISPDYVGAMRETIQESTGAPAFFLLGACGDLAPRNQYVGDPAVADQHGRQLGHAALATLMDMEPAGSRLTYDGVVESGAPLADWKHQERQVSNDLRAVVRTVPLTIKDWPSADELERQRLQCTDRALEERLRRRRDIRRGLGDADTFQLPVYLWKLGEAVLIGCCCEPYSLLQQELRRRFDQHTIICMNLINGSIGYLPPANLYDTDVYQVWQTPFERGSLELVIDAMSEVIEDVLHS